MKGGLFWRTYSVIVAALLITILIFSNFREGHTTSLEGRVILSCEDILAQSTGLDLYLPDLL